MNAHNVITGAMLWGLGNTGAPSSPNATTKIQYGLPSVSSPVSVRLVLLVFPPLNLLLFDV